MNGVGVWDEKISLNERMIVKADLVKWKVKDVWDIRNSLFFLGL